MSISRQNELASVSDAHIIGFTRGSAAGRRPKSKVVVGPVPELSAMTSHADAKVGERKLSARLQPVPDTEFALIARICEGEKELFYDLVRPYERAVYISAHSIVQNEADAEDIAQEAILKALTHLRTFRRESKFSTWLIQITINEARMRLRRDRRSMYDSLDEGNQTEEGDYIPNDFADWRDIPSEELQRKELRQALQKALASLKPIYREVFVLRDIQKMSITDTAKALGITEASVKTRLLRARFHMRDALAPGIDGAWRVGDGSWKKVRPW